MAGIEESIGRGSGADQIVGHIECLELGSEEKAAVKLDLESLKEVCENKKSELREFAEAVILKGPKGVAQDIKAYLDEWREIELNVAVTGIGGSGKSSFINAVRRLRPTMNGAAPVGVVETTRTIRKYQHPYNTKVQFWDLPGEGTPEFRRDNYLEKVEFAKFDFYIIMTAGRFREDDLWLANEVQKREKSFYFVRTMTDKDVADGQHDYPETHTEEKVLSGVRQNCMTELTKGGFPNASIFLISSREPLLWDFPKLEAQILEDIPDLKREVVIHMIRSSCESIIRKKAEHLHSRAWKVAFASALADLSPIPGISVAVNIAAILAESKHYSETFGVDWIELASVTSPSVVVWLFSKFAVSETLTTVLGLLPVVGGLISFPLSFSANFQVLTYIIKNMEEAALVAIKKTVH